MTGRPLALLLTLALLAGLLCSAAKAADVTGVADTSWYSQGESSFTLTSAEQLAGLAELVNEGETFRGVTVTLGNNINLSAFENWTPIGGAAGKEYLVIRDAGEFEEAIETYKLLYDDLDRSYSGSEKDAEFDPEQNYYYVKVRLFSGTFDGGGYTISGLSVTSSIGYIGLFGNTDGTLRNFTVDGTVTYTGGNGDYIGGVAGMLGMGGTISHVTSNVTVDAANGWNVGGIAGFVGTPMSGESAANTVVTMCVNNGAVTSYNKVGGIAGENAGVIELCVNNGKVTATNNSSKNGIGGIVGRNGNNNAPAETGAVINCCNTGAVSSVKWSGGIAGFNNMRSTVKNCYITFGPIRTANFSNPIIGYDETDLGTGVVENNYTLNYAGIYYTDSTDVEVGIRLESDELRTAAYALGGAWRTDPGGGYPVLLWMLNSSTVAFSVTGAAEYTVTVTDRLGVAVAPEADGSYLLVDGQTYDYTAAAAGYRTAAGSLTVAGGEMVSVALEEIAGPVVTVNNMTGTKTPATVTGVENGADYLSGERSFTVTCALPCVVAFTTDGGATYTRLPAAENAGGGYDFTIDLTADTEIVVVLKGDLGLNGTVNGTDALQVRRFAAGLISLTPLQTLASDVNVDGKVNGTDALQLRRLVVGLKTFDW